MSWIKRKKPKRKGDAGPPAWPILLVLGIVAASTYWYVQFGPRGPQNGQAPLTRLTTGVRPLRVAFNQASDRPRVLVMLSPT